MERNKTITPAQFTVSYMPDCEQKWKEIEDTTWGAAVIYTMPGNDAADMIADRMASLHFPAALAAFEAHIRQETWREACEAQRIICANTYDELATEEDTVEKNSIYACICSAPIPEIPKNNEK